MRVVCFRIRGRAGRGGRNNEGYGPQGGMYRPPAQGGYMYGGGPLNTMMVHQGMHRGGPRHGGGGMQQVCAVDRMLPASALSPLAHPGGFHLP